MPHHLYLNELYELEYRSYSRETLDRLADLMASVPCPECGSRDGMIEWSCENIGDPTAYQTWYRLHNLPGCLYVPCWQCNPHGAINGAYTNLTPVQVTAWLKQKGEAHAN